MYINFYCTSAQQHAGEHLVHGVSLKFIHSRRNETFIENNFSAQQRARRQQQQCPLLKYSSCNVDACVPVSAYEYKDTCNNWRNSSISLLGPNIRTPRFLRH